MPQLQYPVISWAGMRKKHYAQTRYSYIPLLWKWVQQVIVYQTTRCQNLRNLSLKIRRRENHKSEVNRYAFLTKHLTARKRLQCLKCNQHGIYANVVIEKEMRSGYGTTK
jgi:hypothetical protein